MADRLSQAFSALSDPTRRAILARLALGDASVNELLEPFDLSQPAISKHIKVLESAGLISRSRVAQKRPCHLEPEPLKQVADWLDHYRHLWTERFDRLEAYLRHTQAESKKGK
jgi:DNA-binding transcriptional ArsR family regulator